VENFGHDLDEVLGSSYEELQNTRTAELRARLFDGQQKDDCREQPPKLAHHRVVRRVCNAESRSTDEALGACFAWCGRRKDRIEGPINLTLVLNRSNAFGLIPRYGEGSRWALTALGVTAAVILLWCALRRSTSPLNALGLAFICAGALENALDRLRLGAVVDLFDVSKLGSFGFLTLPTFQLI